MKMCRFSVQKCRFRDISLDARCFQSVCFKKVVRAQKELPKCSFYKSGKSSTDSSSENQVLPKCSPSAPSKCRKAHGFQSLIPECPLRPLGFQLLNPEWSLRPLGLQFLNPEWSCWWSRSWSLLWSCCLQPNALRATQR